MGIYNELARIQQDLKAPKNLHNNYGNYNYRNAEGILEAVKPLLNGMVLLINDEPIVIGSRYYIKATVTITDGSESVSAVAYAREDEQKKGMDGCQLTGACSSYARKYALNALLMIDDSKDSDDDSVSPKNPKNAPDEESEDKVKPFSRPQGSANATMTKANKATEVPAPGKEEEKKAEADPEVQKYLLGCMKELRTLRGISPAENNKLFDEQKKALIAAGLAPNKSTKEYTMQEAVALIEAMYKNFDPKGTEIKK